MDKQDQRDVSLNNVIPVRFDASYFFDRAIKSREKFQYGKALKYFRRAFALDPTNTVNCCNMAGVLAELGSYEQSNELLQQIVDELDPTMTECYFYMANNFANMDQFEEAEDAVIRYLEQDEEGHYLEEAEAMLDLLQYELERPTKVPMIKAHQPFNEHEAARHLLEQGKFAEAVGCLKEILKQHPQFAAARNNLALAYYYMGRFTDAQRTIEDMLADEPGNLHALCNKAIFLLHEHNEEQLKPLVESLKKTIPFHHEHVFKLATTMGIMQQHEEAYHHFLRLLRDSSLQDDASLYHYVAVAACHLDKYEEAQRYWTQAMKIDEQSNVAKFYLAQLAEAKKSGAPVTLKPNYHYHLPFEEKYKQWLNDRTQLAEQLTTDPLVRSSFFWALRHGDDYTKALVFESLELIADQEVVATLKDYIVDERVDESFRMLALVVLRMIGVTEALSFAFHHRLITVPEGQLPHTLPVWHDEWQQVIECAWSHMGRQYSALDKHAVYVNWMSFLTKQYPDIKAVTKPAYFAAALEYVTLKRRKFKVTYDELAIKYELSIATISKYAKMIRAVLEATPVK